MSMGMTQMTSLISSANTLKNMNNLNASRTQMNGQSRVLSTEIEADKDMGIDTKKKEEHLAQAEDRLQGIEENIGDTMTDLNERIEADREKICEEEAGQIREETAAKEKSAQNDDKTTLTPAAVLELSGECLVINNSIGEQSAESGVSGESRPDVGNAVAKTKTKTSDVSTGELKMRVAAAAYAKGKSTGDAAVHSR